MPPVNLRFGGGVGESTLNPIVAVWLLVAVVLVLVLPRNKAVTPFLLAFFTIPIGEVLVIGGFHFTALRVLVLAGLARRAAFTKNGPDGRYPGRFNSVDRAVILWSVLAVIGGFLEFLQMPAFVNELGVLLDTLGGYLVVRSLVPDEEAIRRVIGTLAVICTILGVTMVYEQIGHVNVFGLLGGISPGVVVREGKIRSSGTMGCLHAGAFAGSVIPLFIWLWKVNGYRRAAIFGLLGATAMVITSNSSTAQLAILGSIVGLSFWKLRKKMRVVRWLLAGTLVGLHLVMKAPVWALIARIDLTGSSSGYHRYLLIDMTVNHFSKWWLIGTTDYVNWAWDSWDLCDQWVAVALTGGLLPLIFYIRVFSRSFGIIGDARKRATGDRPKEWQLWCLGSALFAGVVAHFGINYVAQLQMSLFLLIACIAVAVRDSKRLQVPTTKAESAKPTVEPVAAIA